MIFFKVILLYCPVIVSGKPQQLRQLHFQQLQRNTAVKSAQQLAQQKVAASM